MGLLLSLACGAPKEEEDEPSEPDDDTSVPMDDTAGDTDCDAVDYYRDQDGDGFGDPDVVESACTPVDGYVTVEHDCDDTDASTFPGAAETCDYVDNNCSGDADEDATDSSTWYVDADGDGVGGDTTVDACDAPSGTTDTGGDCDDSDADVSPFGVEICGDAKDNDCDGRESACDWSGEWAVTEADSVLLGRGAGSYFGAEMAVGDVDGDGATDLVITARFEDSWVLNGGALYVVPLASAAGTVEASAVASSMVYAAEAETYLGIYAAVLGDLDADGADEVAVVEPLSSTAWLLGALPAGESELEAVALVSADCDRVAAVGTWESPGLWLCVDHDGGDETVYLLDIDGANQGQIEGSADNDAFGTGGTLAVELDGDGLDELAITAESHDAPGTNAGALFIFSGDRTAAGYRINADDADGVVYGRADDDFGTALGNGGDVDGDGLEDLLAGRPYHSSDAVDGGAFCVIGADYTTLDEARSARAIVEGEDGGIEVAAGDPAAQDFDGDGVADVVMGWPIDSRAGSYNGAIAVVYGPLSGTHLVADATTVFVGGDDEDRLGADILGLGDTDGDGTDDLLLGAYYAVGESYLDRSGAAYLVRGR